MYSPGVNTLVLSVIIFRTSAWFFRHCFWRHLTARRDRFDGSCRCITSCFSTHCLVQLMMLFIAVFFAILCKPKFPDFSVHRFDAFYPQGLFMTGNPTVPLMWLKSLEPGSSSRWVDDGSSSSLGLSQGTEHAHGWLLSTLRAVNHCLPCRPEVVTTNLKPICHDAGAWVSMFGFQTIGGSTYITIDYVYAGCLYLLYII